MGLEGSYSFAGIGAAEAKPRENEYRSGVPYAGVGLTALLSMPALRTTGVRVMNQGAADALIVLGHGNKEKAVTGELLTKAFVSTTVYRGKLQFGAVKPKSVSITAAAGGSTPLTDPAGDGVLKDTASVSRGTINYRTGEFNITFGTAVTEPVVAAYTHTDFSQFASPTQTKTQAAAAVPFVMQASFGRVVPRSVSMTDGVVTVVDDGKGNMIETTGGGAVLRGTIDYATGVVTLTSISVPLVGTVTMTFTFNPFGALLVKGGGHHGVNILSDGIPELGSEAWADGIKGESKVAIMGVSRGAGSTDIVAWVSHHLEESYRVQEEYAGFPPGGASNDPRVSGS
jgi:hypothetical protein